MGNVKIGDVLIEQKVLNKTIKLDDAGYVLVLSLNKLTEQIEKLRLSL